MKLTGEEHAILRECSGHGYGSGHIELVELYGYGGAHRGPVPGGDTRAATLAILAILNERGLVERVSATEWRATPEGEQVYLTTFPNDEDEDPTQKAAYDLYVEECRQRKVGASDFLGWAWYQYYKSLDEVTA